MVWDVWDITFHDKKANMAAYDLVVGQGLQVRENVIYFGTSDSFQARKLVESFLRPKIGRYRDVEVTAKIEIVSTAKTDGVNEDASHWFGISVRALRTDHWDAYLFYVRKDGGIEFGIRGNKIKKPPVPEVSSQAVTIRIRAEGERVQTWVNDRPYHDWLDEQKEFIRKGDIYLISYGALVKIYEVEVRIKKRYAPLLRFVKRFWKVLVAISVIAGIIGLILQLLSWYNRSG